MIHYLGKKVEIEIDPFIKTSWNKAKKWRYGYNEQINVIIISKDGTLGDVYNVNGINIGLPEVPNKKEIINHEKFPKDQKWKREELPQGLNEKTQNEPRFEQYIDLQFKRRFEGVWIYIKGQPVYIPGTYWFGIQWVRDEVDYPDFRNIQNELMIFWEACKADQRCYGMQYVKNRRIGASFLSIVELLESGSINEDKLLGIVSKSGGDSQKLFNRLVKGFKRLPCFFKPLQDGTNTPKKELVFDVPTKRKGKNDVESEEGLSTIIYWVNTTINAMDGDAIFRSVLDECFGEGTKILMHDMSFKNIEDIKANDVVLVEGGKKVRVAKTMNGVDEMFLVKQPYSKDYIVSSKHKLYLEQRCKVDGIKDDGVKTMTPEEFINLKKYRKRTTFGVRSNGIELPYSEVKIEPYILGLWLGDGLNDSSTILVNIEKDAEIANYIKKYVEDNNFSLSIKNTKSEVCKKYSINRPEGNQGRYRKLLENKFRTNLKKYNLLNNKHVPIDYVNNSKDIRLKLLAGLLDSDGYLSKKGGSYTYELALNRIEIFEDVVKIIRSLGFKTGVRIKKSNYNTNNYVVNISGNIQEIPCLLKRRQVPIDYERKYCPNINKISVEPIGKNKYFGIQLEAYNDNDRRLILEDFTISMNCGKYPKDVPFDKYWYVVKTSHSKGIRITGKAMCVSTVNAKSKGGQEYENIWDASDINVRDKNGQTESGLYRIFIAAKYCLEGMFDQYGFTIIEDPEKPIMTDEGIETTIGSITWLQNKADSIKNPEDLNEFYRQFPNEVEDAFRDESGNCAFNTINLAEQLKHNKNVLLDNTTGNEEVERGNFSWVNGIQDTTVQWNPDPLNGRFWIAKKCHPSPEYRNLKEKKTVNGITAWSPLNEHIGCFGVDPYNTSEAADGKGSMGAILLTTKYNTGPFPNNALILEYLDRAPKIELFFEDVLMAMVYFSMPMLCELSNFEFLRMIKNRGYRHFSLNNPYKTYAELIPAEKELGGVPPQNDKIGEQQFYATEAYVFDYMGVAKNDQNRLVGEMGYFPFSRTIQQLQKVDLRKRTKFDAYIGLSLSLIGNQKRIYKAIEQKPIQLSTLFKTFDNSGNVSKSY